MPWRPRDHSADAGGDPEVLQTKQALRTEVWEALAEAGAARFPGAHGRIPNFPGAEDAAERLRGTDLWRAATALKANPDAPQWPVRQRALEDGIVVYMAVPRLADPEPFFLLDPGRLAVSPRKASSIKGAARHGSAVPVDALEPVDVVVTGCVAVDGTGARLGKGGGFSDLEFAVAAAAGLVGPDTVVVTTVHPLQVLDAGRIPMTSHDVPLDVIVTAEEVIACDPSHPRPEDIDWPQLTEEKINAIPLLQTLRDRG
ncbi:MAG: 5-formyltetrahydrofolate cyclo-ligase [Actinomycetota bacterium]|nr:5-formyltetrahydrofolate cyclo-ligase [Actinomycetota bacterium]